MKPAFPNEVVGKDDFEICAEFGIGLAGCDVMIEGAAVPKISLTGFPALIREDGFVFDGGSFWDNEDPLALMSFAIASIAAWSCSYFSSARFSSSDSES